MQALVTAIYAGDKQAEQVLFRELFVRFELFMLKRADEGIARDIAQDACVTVFEKFREKVSAEEFLPWSYGVLKMTAKRHAQIESRRQAREMHLPEGFEIPDRKSPDPMLRPHLKHCLEWLVRTHRRYARIFELHWHGCSTAEVCSELGLNSAQYYVYLGRSRRLLQDCLKERGIHV